jgi:uncharacterized protein (DUF1501 family)
MLSRRTFLRNSTLFALAPTVPTFLAATARAVSPEREGKILVVVQLEGGNDGINTVVPFADEGYGKFRKALRLPTAQLIKVNDQVGLHPSLGDAGQLLESRRLAIIQGVGYPNPSRSHFRSMAIWQTARFDPEQHNGLGWLGRALDGGPRQAAGTPAALFIGVEAPPVALRSRYASASALAQLDDWALAVDTDPRKTLTPAESEPDLVAFVRRSNLDAYTAADRMTELARTVDQSSRYPATGLAERLRLVAQLVKANLGTRIFYTIQSGYDTHHSQLGMHALQLAEFGGALRAFLDDLSAANLADRVAMLAFSEFGRRVRENGSQGTDHGTAGPVFLAGTDVQAGLVGESPKLLDLEDGDLKMTTDFRGIYATVLEDWLGLSSKPALHGVFAKLPLFRS